MCTPPRSRGAVTQLAEVPRGRLRVTTPLNFGFLAPIVVSFTARFEAEGLTVHPAATDYEAGAARSDMRWLPSAAALDGSGRAIKEWVGQLFLQLQAGRQ